MKKFHLGDIISASVRFVIGPGDHEEIDEIYAHMTEKKYNGSFKGDQTILNECISSLKKQHKFLSTPDFQAKVDLLIQAYLKDPENRTESCDTFLKEQIGEHGEYLDVDQL